MIRKPLKQTANSALKHLRLLQHNDKTMTGRCQYYDVKSKKVWMDAQFEMPRTGRLNNSGRKKNSSTREGGAVAIRRFLWYPYLQERRCSASAAVMLPLLGSPMCRTLRGSSIFCRPPRVRVFLYMSYSRRYSVMEIWNNVLALLTLLVTVIIGTAKITWTIAQAIFRDSHRAKHDSKK